MGKPLRRGALALALLVIGAIVGTQTSSWYPLLGIAGLVYAFGYLVDLRWVQERIPLIQPPDAEYRAVYQAGTTLERAVSELFFSQTKVPAEKPVSDRESWNRKLEEWDEDYWRFIHKHFYSREPRLRSGPWKLETVVEYEGEGWVEVALSYLSYRLKVLNELLPDLPA